MKIIREPEKLEIEKRFSDMCKSKPVSRIDLEKPIREEINRIRQNIIKKIV